jgi:hypothetical protein
MSIYISGVDILEGKYVKAVWYQQVDSGTTGTVTPPANGEIVLDQFASGVDALVSKVSGGFPSEESPVDALGNFVTATMDSGGDFTLSAAPTAYPVALIYAYRIKFSHFDIEHSLLADDVGNITGGAPGELPDGIKTGNILRWNETTHAWEVKEEPFVLDEVKLTPKSSSTGAEGTIFYCSDDNYVYVGVE